MKDEGISITNGMNIPYRYIFLEGGHYEYCQFKRFKFRRNQ